MIVYCLKCNTEMDSEPNKIGNDHFCRCGAKIFVEEPQPNEENFKKIKNFEAWLNNQDCPEEIHDAYHHGVRSHMVSQSFEIMKLKERNIVDEVKVRSTRGGFSIMVNGIAINIGHLQENLKEILNNGPDIPQDILGKLIWKRLK